MARYLIPEYKLPELEKVVNKIRNKGAEVTFNVLNDHVPVDVSPRFGRDFTINCVEVEVQGSYRMNGWDFVGTIEHASPENIIRIADQRFSGRVPERYRTAGKECEHCHIRRDRNDTYLVYNEDEDMFRQVGRTCLKNYTQGLDAEVCAEMVSILAEIARLNATARQGNIEINDDEFNYLLRNSYIGYPMEAAKKKAYQYVVRNGYTPGETGKNFATELFRNSQNMQDATDEQIQAVQDWLRTSIQNEPNDYLRNALAAWTKGYFDKRDAGLITSAVSSYLRAMERQRAEQERQRARQDRLNAEGNDHAGNVGDKVQLVIDSVSVLYYREGGGYYSYNRYPVYKIISTDGLVYSWGCTNTELELVPGDILQGTIKALRELRDGTRCTELTRCKVIGNQPRYRGFFNN